MNQLISKSLLGLAGVTFLICASQSTMALVPNNVGVILNSGSTNTVGYRIYVSPSGEVNYVYGKGSGQAKLPEKLTKRFFRDLKLAEPLSNLSVKPNCVKSTSFGTTTTVSLGGQQSPDITCPGNGKALRLENDVIAITKTLKVVNVPNSQGKPLPPQNF